MSEETVDRHKERMARKKEVQDRKLAEATREQGLLVVYTGTGKGKTTASLGTVFRALGHGMTVGVVQFIKGAIPTGESSLAARLAPQLRWYVLGEGFTWETQDRSRDEAAARRGWEKAVELIRDPEVDLVVLDELNVVLKLGLLPAGEVLDELASRREMLHVVVTGRGAPPDLIELADLVTDMGAVKHPFRSGIKPQKGIEF